MRGEPGDRCLERLDHRITLEEDAGDGRRRLVGLAGFESIERLEVAAPRDADVRRRDLPPARRRDTEDHARGRARLDGDVVAGARDAIGRWRRRRANGARRQRSVDHQVLRPR